MWNKKRKFDHYVGTCPLVPYKVFGNDYCLMLDLKVIEEKGFSAILGKYVNEEKAKIENGFAYLIPEYDSYYFKPQSYKKRKLLQYVDDKQFVAMINQAQIVQKAASREPGAPKTYFLKMNQDLIMRYQCMMIVALLIDEGLAHMEDAGSDVYILYSFRQQLEKRSKIQSDLSHFRTLLGESDNLAAMIELFEAGTYRNGKFVISQAEVNDAELNLEMMSLTDIGLAKHNSSGSYEVEQQVASWILDYVGKTSDRISFGNTYT